MFSALFLSAALMGQAAPSVDRNCRDDDGNDRCAAENRAEVLNTLGMKSIEEELVAGAEVYRTLQVDGYGNVMSGIAFERRVGSAPQVVVYGADGNRMSAPVTLSDWQAVKNDAVFADREVVRPSDQNDASICLHAWVSTVEITNASERGTPVPTVRRRTESACGGGLTNRFAFDLVSKAIKAFPECDALDPEDHRNDASRLKTCVGFKGDRLAAAELMNQIGWRVVPHEGADRPAAWMAKFGINARVKLDWAGEKVAGDGGFRNNPVAAFLVRQKAEHPSLRGYILGFNGVSSTRVETTGRWEIDRPDDQIQTAAFRQIWLWDDAGLGWKLDSWTVEPFATASR